MESDSKDNKNGGDAQTPLKREPKPISKSKRSTRRRCNGSAIDKQQGELPPNLLPKFPSEKPQRRKPDSKDKHNNNDGMEATPMCPTDKLLEDEENDRSLERDGEIVVEEEEMEIVDETQEGGAMTDQPSSDDPPKKPLRPTSKPSKIELRSGRSLKSGRLKKPSDLEKKASDREKQIDSKRKDVPKKYSSEDGSSDRKDNTKKGVPGKGKGSNNNNTKRSMIRKNPPRCPSPVNNTQDMPSAPVRSLTVPNTRLDRSTRQPKSNDEKPKKATQPTSAPPPPQPPPSLVPGKKDPGAQPAAQPGGQTPQKLKKPSPVAGQQQPTALEDPKKKKKVGFLKQVYHKTKFWGRRSDCVMDPTTEMLSKSYVIPEYDFKNGFDFQPDPKKFFNDEDYILRCKNACSTKEEVFINNRPFWLHRLPTDTVPKVRIQLHRPLRQLYNGNPSSFMTKMSRKDPFLDPKNDPLDKLKIVDKAIGIDPIDPTKDKELKRVCANTFHGTMMFEIDKQQWDEQMKKKEQEGKGDGKLKVQNKKNSLEEEAPGKKVVFTVPEKNILNVYNRKHRPIPATNGNSKRQFKQAEYRIGAKKIPRKPTATSPASTSSNSSSASITFTSSGEGKKPLN